MTALVRSRQLSRRRLLTVGHSYVSRQNRLLAEAISNASNGEWQVTVAAPEHYKGNPRFGDLKPETLMVGQDEKVKVVGIPVMFSDRVHFALYGTRLRALMASGFDMVHCWEEPYMIPGAQMAIWAPRHATVTFSTWQNISKSYPPPFNWLERRTISRADGWIAGAVLTEQALQGRAIYRDRPHQVIGFGVDLEKFHPDLSARRRVRSALGWSSDDETAVVGYLGRFTKPKGLPMMLKALGNIKRPWRALFVGSGALEGELNEWSKRFGSKVRVVSGISNSEVPEYLNAMDVLCVPSQTTPIWREQFGRVLIEAFACGVSVIASSSGEIPYVVGSAGLVIDERDEDEWRREIEALIVDSTRRKNLADQGRARANEHFSWPAVGRKYVDFLDTLDRAKRQCAVVNR